ncbi:MAG: hydroxyacid dehydrogenase, partial [Anaerolineaceae bacterium]
PDPAPVLAVTHEIKTALETLVVPIFMNDRTVIARTAGVGPLSKSDAILYGAVGPLARASGIETDIRSDAPYAAYQELGFKMVTAQEGDVRARVVVRALEMLESVRLIEAALENLPSGAININEPYPIIPVGEVTVRAEAPRGEVVYYLKSDGSDIPERVKIRTPSYVNIPATRAMVKGQHLGDLSIIQASVDPCLSCTDR